MAEVVLNTEDLLVLGGPDTINVEVDFGPQGDRGSLFFVGNGKPDVVDIGQDPNVFDLYINLLTTDDEYLMIYQYVDVLGTLQWQPLTKLIPNTYVSNKSIDFTTQNYCYIPIADIVDPSYVGGVDASNFSVQVTFGTSAGFPIVSSIKTEVVTVSSIQNLKITFYAKEFDGTNWIDISGSRTANLHISVV
jgi:hypothetical protein